MGLLDGLLNDPNSMAQLSLGAGLLGGGNFGQALNRGLLGYQETLNGAQDRALKKTYTQAQLDNLRSEIASREVAMQKAKQLQDFVGSLGAAQASPGMQTGPAPQSAPMLGQGITGNGGSASMPGQGINSDGGTAPMPQGPAQGGVGNNPLLGLDIAKIAKLKALGGPDLLDAFKYANDPLQLQAGSTYRDRVTGAERTIPLLDKGQVFNGGRITNIPGAVDAAAESAGALARATEGAKAQNDLTQVYDPTVGGMVFKSRAQVLSNTPQPPMPSGGGLRNMGQGMLSPDLQALIQRDAQANGIQNPTVNFNGAGPRGRYELASPPNQTTAPANMAAQPSSATLADKAGANLNDSWIKNSYEPVLTANKAADDMITNVRVARDAISKMGGTGWGTETKAQAASVLEGLGMASGNAKMYATNSQVFQNTAMNRLATVLNAATGPQTEGDAARASKQFASLGSTTDANKFILDLAEAKAQRDQAKARFYQAAQPIAREKGDLTEVDREWQKRAPSIFDMPAMKGWGK